MSLIKALQWVPGENPLATKKPKDLTCTDDVRLRVDAFISGGEITIPPIEIPPIEFPETLNVVPPRYQSVLSPNSTEVLLGGIGYGAVLTATLPAIANCSATSIFVHHYASVPAINHSRIEVSISGHVIAILYGGDFFNLYPNNLNQDVTVTWVAGIEPENLVVSLNQFVESIVP